MYTHTYTLILILIMLSLACSPSDIIYSNINSPGNVVFNNTVKVLLYGGYFFVTMKLHERKYNTLRQNHYTVTFVVCFN